MGRRQLSVPSRSTAYKWSDSACSRFFCNVNSLERIFVQFAHSLPPILGKMSMSFFYCAWSPKAPFTHVRAPMANGRTRVKLERNRPVSCGRSSPSVRRRRKDIPPCASVACSRHSCLARHALKVFIRLLGDHDYSKGLEGFDTTIVTSNLRTCLAITNSLPSSLMLTPPDR